MTVFELEILALEQCEWELLSRRGIERTDPPSSRLNSDMQFAFYWGMNDDNGLPETARPTIDKNIDVYSAGSLARHLINMGGQSDEDI